MAKKTVSSVKKKAWAWFSKYIRLRDCIITTHTDEEGLCVTCQCRFPFKKLQAGHFIPGRRKGVLFSEIGVHAQCYGCNFFRNGEMPKYEKYMREKYGQDTLDKLWDKARELTQWKVFQLEEVEAEYKAKYKQLVKDFKTHAHNSDIPSLAQALENTVLQADTYSQS